MGNFCVGITTEAGTAGAHSLSHEDGGNMDTFIDIAILVSTYASLSLVCAALLRVVWTQPRRKMDESMTTHGW
jgi:hypothetical protein